jgi:type IV secretory pathway VirB4 component
MATESASQHFVPVRDIHEGVVMLKNGQMVMVLLASSINFALKSSDEQRAILAQFQSFLNTLDFSLQIYIQSRRLDIRPYIEILREREVLQDNDLMRIQLREYIEFVTVFTKEVDIMSKNFFVVVPYTPATTDLRGLKTLLHTQHETNEPFNEERFAEQRSQLEQRVAVVEQGLARIGIRTVSLGNEELTELYYHIFNPADDTHAPQA